METINHLLECWSSNIHSHFDYEVFGTRKDSVGTQPFNSHKNRFFLNNYDTNFIKQITTMPVADILSISAAKLLEDD